MTDTNDKLTMPPGFRWVKNGIYTEGALLSDYDPRRSGTSVRRCIDERDAIEIAQAIVAPAVEAATAELRAELERVEAGEANALQFAIARAEKAEALLAKVAERAAKAAEEYQNIVNGNPPGVERDAESVADSAIEDFEGLVRLARGEK